MAFFIGVSNRGKDLFNCSASQYFKELTVLLFSKFVLSRVENTASTGWGPSSETDRDRGGQRWRLTKRQRLTYSIRERDRQTRQTDRQTNRQTDKVRETETDIETETGRVKETETDIERDK